MARWSVLMTASLSDHGAAFHRGSLLAVLSTFLLFSVCVTLLLALCAAHSPPLNVLNLRRSSSFGEKACEGGLAIAPPEEFRKQEFGFRLSSSASAAINKLGSSFRIASFRDPSTSFRNSSFRISSIRMDSSKQVDGVEDSLPGAEEQASPEPAVWQRVILLGERCTPLSFSGLVLYDEQGNLLPPSCGEDLPSMEDGVRTPGTSSSSQIEVKTGL